MDNESGRVEPIANESTPGVSDSSAVTYLTTDQLAARIHYDARSIRTQLKDSVLIEGTHYIRPFGGRKLLYIWEAIERDMAAFSNNAAARKSKPSPAASPQNNGRKWSPIEDAHLRSEWGSADIGEISRALGRSRQAIYVRADALGLTRPNAWSEQELALMRDHYQDEGPEGLALRTGRTPKAIQLQGRRMGLLLRPKHEPWSKDEDDVLRQHVGILPLRRIHQLYFMPKAGWPTGKEFSRSYAAVAQRCSALGITLDRQDAATLGREGDD